MPPLSGTTPRLANPGSKRVRGAPEPHVATEREVEAVARGGAVDHAEHRSVHLLQDHRRQCRHVDRPGVDRARGRADAGAGRGVLEVEPGAESLARAGEEHAAHAGVGVGVARARSTTAGACGPRSRFAGAGGSG